MLGVAAVPLVEPDDVHAAGERLGGHAAHVVRVARAVQTVQGDERGMFPRPRLPVAMRQHPVADVDVEVADGRRRQPGKYRGLPQLYTVIA